MNKIKKIHLMGIGGSGMSGVALLAEKMGYEVSGCDLEENSAYANNIFKGHDPKHLEGIDLLVISPAIKFQNSDNPEYVEAVKRGIAVTWEEFVGKYLVEGKKLICVAGTHGKSTTTAMVGKLLIDAGLDPTVLLGAKVPEWGGNARYGNGEYFVLEADEFNNNFLNYHPDIAIINNIEFDHPDFFNNEDEVKKSFDGFKKNLKGEKLLITSDDSPGKHFNLKVFGEHNQKNANMVFVLGKKLGIAEDTIVDSLESFTGIERRMQLIAKRSGVKIYDDYAHHPTAIKTTLEGVREKFPTSKILVVDEPHGYKRTKALLSEYTGVFDSADKVMIGPIFAARDKMDESVSPKKVVEVSNHTNATDFDSFEDLTKKLKLEIKNYDIIVVMGAGKSYLWAKQIAHLIPLTFKDITTFQIGGEIENYIEISSKDEVPEIIKKIKKEGGKIFIIGGGSDILVSDNKFEGYVVKFIGNRLEVKDDKIIAEAGVKWWKLVDEAVTNNLQGVEKMAGIPGTVGAAPIQNIGAYGQEISQVFESLEAYDIDKEKFITLAKSDCKFGYRESIFKTEEYWQKYLIVKVTLKLRKNDGSKSDLLEAKNETIKTRNDKLEDPKKVGNAGSFFKNPIVTQNVLDPIKREYPDVVVFPFEDKFKISAGWLIDKAGWKGKSIGNAGISPKHALIVINKTGQAKASEIYNLSEEVIKDVKEKFNITLEREVQLINF